MKQVVFRLRVQKAALKRMELLLYRIAGRLLLEHDHEPEFRAHHQGLQRLIACENTPIGQTAQLEQKPRALKPLTFSQKNIPLPSWFGISFQPIHKKHPEYPKGAIEVQTVYLKTPARKSGVRPGDRIVAIDQKQLREPYEIRERVMMATPPKPLRMRIIRNGRPIDLFVTLKRLIEPPSMKLPPIVGRRLSSLGGIELLSKQKLLPDPKKHTIMLFFWATWCGPCKAALPTMRRWQKKYAHRGLRIVTSSNEKAFVIARWLRSHPQDMPFYNSRDPKNALARKMQVRATPTFVILKNGKVSLYHVGSGRLHLLEQKFVKLLD